MASSFSEYSKLRDIAQKRLGRLSAAGMKQAAGIKIPTVKELRKEGITAAQAVKDIKQFLSAPTTVKEFRKTPGDLYPAFKADRGRFYTGASADIKKRESRRRYREKNKEIYAGLTVDQQKLLKAARKLHVYISPSQAEAFEEYIKYRHAQGVGSIEYWISTVVEDFRDYRKQNPGHTAESIIKDFDRYVADRKGLTKIFEKIESGKDPTVKQSDVFNKAWEKFVKKPVKRGNKQK